MNDIILIVTETDLTNLIRDLSEGWQSLQIRYLSEYKGHHYYNIRLTKRQVHALGVTTIKNTYQAAEYNAHKTIQEQVSELP